MLSIADAEHVADLWSEALGLRDGGVCAGSPAHVFYIVDDGWGDFQEPDQH